MNKKFFTTIGMAVLLFAAVVSARPVSAITVNSSPVVVAQVAPTDASSDSEAQATEEAVQQTAVTRQKAAGIWNQVKLFFVDVYKTVDAWRVRQLDVWRAIKAEKEQQLADTESQFEQNKADRVDRVLEADQATLYNGVADDFNGNAFLLKVYAFGLSIFVIILHRASFFMRS